MTGHTRSGWVIRLRRGRVTRSEKRAEDDHFIEDHFSGNVTVLENSPAREQAHYYVRFYHGGNTWDERHVMGERGPGGWDLEQGTQTYLKNLLQYEYQERRG